MGITRRAALAAIATVPSLAAAAPASPAPQSAPARYGRIGKFIATPGQRDALIAIVAEATAAMPGCLSYVIAKDLADPDGVWVTETWDSAASHRASLALPSVRAAMTKGKHLIAGTAERFETEPVARLDRARLP